MKLSDSTQKRLLLSLLRKGRWKVFSTRFNQRIFSDEVCYGLKRNLQEPYEQTRSPALSFVVRPMGKQEILDLLDFGDANGDTDGIYERLSRLLFAQADISTCYGAITEEGVPCFMQWLINSRENAKMMGYHGSYFPSLCDNEVLLEGAFTPEKFRGKGIMSSAMFQVSEKGREQGARWAITFVNHSNTASLRGCFRAGFVPFLIRTSSWRLFRQKLTFTPINESDQVLALYRNLLKNKDFLDARAR